MTRNTGGAVRESYQLRNLGVPAESCLEIETLNCCAAQDETACFLSFRREARPIVRLDA
jgi:hypothetical protein